MQNVSDWLRCYFELSSEINFRFCSSIQASIRFWRPLSVHSLRAFSSRSISALIIATSPLESMMQVYAAVHFRMPDIRTTFGTPFSRTLRKREYEGCPFPGRIGMK
jgi:hypothetical protein